MTSSTKETDNPPNFPSPQLQWVWGVPGNMLTTDLVVEGADVQGRVPRGVLGPHVGPIEEQMLQVLHVSIPAGLRQEATL